MTTTRRKFAATLLAGGVSLFLPKVVKPSKWKFSPNPARERNYLLIAERKFDPFCVEPGTVYFNTNDQSFRIYDGKRWLTCGGHLKGKLISGT